MTRKILTLNYRSFFQAKLINKLVTLVDVSEHEKRFQKCLKKPMYFELPQVNVNVSDHLETPAELKFVPVP